MKYPIIISYVILSIMAVYYLGMPTYILVSKCCKSEYRTLVRSQKQQGQEPYCLTCKKWCELIEISVEEL
tara:strand:+ start:236 stop:445 length:210 start_codon:yes stop_codon:yes gene_type:complete